MSRAFGLRDIPLVAGLEKGGILLDLEEKFLGSQSPLPSAMAFLFSLSRRGRPTYVLDESRNGVPLRGFLQARNHSQGTEADVVYLAPSLGGKPGERDIWLSLLGDFCQKKGEKRVQRFFAKIPEEEKEALEVFRESGFGAYARRHIFARFLKVRAGEPKPTSPWRPRLQEDDWGLLRLYSTVTPRPIQQAEGLERQKAGPPAMARRVGAKEYVVYGPGEIIAFTRIIPGKKGYWLKFILHPQVEKGGVELLNAALGLIPPTAEGPVYCGVREYEVALKGSISAAGFEPLAEEVLLVKHTAVRAEVVETQPRSILEKKTERITPVGARRED